MEDASSASVAATFLQRFSDGEFGAADELIHPEAPLEGVGDLAVFFSILLTDFLATVVLRSVPTEVTETTVIEEGPTMASVEASVEVYDAVTIEALVELHPDTSNGESDSDGRRDGWRIWNVDLEL